jgi:hypothetical protein
MPYAKTATGRGIPSMTRDFGKNVYKARLQGIGYMAKNKELAERLRKARDPLGPFGDFAYYRISEIEAVATELEQLENEIT